MGNKTNKPGIFDRLNSTCNTKDGKVMMNFDLYSKTNSRDSTERTRFKRPTPLTARRASPMDDSYYASTV